MSIWCYSDQWSHDQNYFWYQGYGSSKLLYTNGVGMYNSTTGRGANAGLEGSNNNIL